jgi:aerobic-type carbon monoxide dehydrogenase small subunit (CoxS/CutS family)
LRTVRVNSVPYGVPEGGRRLVDWLRDDLGLTGTKVGCGTGQCGSCSVIVNGELRLACCELVHGVADAEITTIEGVAALQEAVPLLEAFVRHGASQCGFCRPGMVLAAWVMPPDRRCESDAVREAIAGNLCRCTGYAQIVAAVMESKSAWGPVPRLEAADSHAGIAFRCSRPRPRTERTDESPR